jgi:hypothetical protein
VGDNKMKTVNPKKKNDFLDELATMLLKERVERARKQAKKEIHTIQRLNVESIRTLKIKQTNKKWISHAELKKKLGF